MLCRWPATVVPGARNMIRSEYVAVYSVDSKTVVVTGRLPPHLHPPCRRLATHTYSTLTHTGGSANAVWIKTGAFPVAQIPA